MHVQNAIVLLIYPCHNCCLGPTTILCNGRTHSAQDPDVPPQLYQLVVEPLAEKHLPTVLGDKGLVLRADRSEFVTDLMVKDMHC